LNASNIKFVGEVDFAEKVKLMRGAKALLFPIDRDEPFGLVMIEAMACGTPVIAYDRGSVKEVVVGGVTGTIVNDMEGMAGSMGGIGSLERIECRKHVENKFTLKMMVDKYEEIYKKLFKK
jgi:glycosyltransferase involved in cell wall biosynthesis